jgi:serine/threonine protein phosphatase PrpC
MQMKSFKQQNYEQAMIETYVKFDDLLRMEKVDTFLKESTGSKEFTRIEDDIRIYGGVNEMGGSYITTEIKHTETRESGERRDSFKGSEKGLSEKSSNKNKNKENDERKIISLPNPVSPRKTNRDQREKCIDLTKSHYSPSSNNTPKSIDERPYKRDTIEVLTYEDKQVTINYSDPKDQIMGVQSELLAKDMGTTANILLIKNNYLFLANVGDSLAVLFKNGEAIRLNQEHKTSLPSEFTRISKSGARIINNRIEGRLNLTRAIGDLAFKSDGKLKFYEQSVTAYPEITKMKISKDFEFILMGCDGVWDCVDVQKVCEHISMQLRMKVKISSILAELLDQIISKTNNSNLIFN